MVHRGQAGLPELLGQMVKRELPEQAEHREHLEQMGRMGLPALLEPAALQGWMVNLALLGQAGLQGHPALTVRLEPLGLPELLGQVELLEPVEDFQLYTKQLLELSLKLIVAEQSFPITGRRVMLP